MATILVADDSRLARRVSVRLLQEDGHQTVEAADGQQAVALARQAKVDLVLLDIVMPEVDGYEALRLMKADPELRDIPVIVISGGGEDDAAVRCIELGAVDYLTKPFNATLLRARTGVSLEKKRLRDREKEYLRHVAELTAAAVAVEDNAFDPLRLAPTASRGDELGLLARVFQRMAVEMRARQQRLEQEVQQLRIEIDQAKMVRQVAEITETDFFRDLERKAAQLRAGRPLDSMPQADVTRDSEAAHG